MNSLNKDIAQHWIIPVTQKLQFNVSEWSAWSPSLTSKEDWESWSTSNNLINPLTRANEDSSAKGPSVSFLPISLRKKLSPVSKVLLFLCNQCLKDSLAEEMQIIFASRYGEAASTVELLESLAKNEPSSPMAFSRSVHNFAVGLNSIAMRNYSANTAIAAMEDTFYAGLTESLIKLYSSAANRILFVYAEDVTHEVFSDFYEVPCPFGLAFVLEKVANHGLEIAGNECLQIRLAGNENQIPDSILFLKNVIDLKIKNVGC